MLFSVPVTPYQLPPVQSVRFARPVRRAPETLRSAQTLARFSWGLGAISASAISMIANTVESVEGYRSGTISYRNNNPGNLIYVGQPGATPGEGGFAYFQDYSSGRAALERQIGLYAGRGLTIQGMAQVYAPWGHGNNNPDVYAGRIASALGVPATTPLSMLDSPGGSVQLPAVVPAGDQETWFSDTSIALAVGALSLVVAVIAFGD
jgi:hypothetical protein